MLRNPFDLGCLHVWLGRNESLLLLKVIWWDWILLQELKQNQIQNSAKNKRHK